MCMYIYIYIYIYVWRGALAAEASIGGRLGVFIISIMLYILIIPVSDK